MNQEIMIYIISGLFFLGIFIFVFSPGPDDAAGGGEKTRLGYLYERKEVVYENLRDLNFEHKAGKFTESDYESMRDNMEAEVARVLAEIKVLESVKA